MLGFLLLQCMVLLYPNSSWYNGWIGFLLEPVVASELILKIRCFLREFLFFHMLFEHLSLNSPLQLPQTGSCKSWRFLGYILYFLIHASKDL